YGVPRTVPNIRTYRPVPLTSRVCVPPAPVVVEKTVVQADASADTWIWNALAYAASQVSTTWQTDCEAPRSTWIHCGSPKALDQRVPLLPSTAADAGNVAFSSEEAVAGLPRAAMALAHPAPTVPR